ncbi:MAG: hypothetical protein GXY83_27760 [Rhodopirellula sp.]|nr:hypothetical protein [Rhodopirellula sp.]
MITLKPDEAAKADQFLDEQHDRLSRLGESLFETFGYDRKTKRVSSQIRNLQQIVCSATLFADIEDFVKNQMGKGTASARDWQRVGEEVLKQLRDLRQKAMGMAESPDAQLAVRLRLARGWVRAVVSEYLFRVACAEMENRDGRV